MTKEFILQPAQPGQTNIIKAYSKVTSEIGERYIYFRDLTVTLPDQNATWIGDTISQVNFATLNDVFTKVSQVALVSSSIESKYKANVLRTLVSGIANITMKTLGDTGLQGYGKRRLQAGMGIGSRYDDTSLQKLTLARAFSQVTTLIRDDPEIMRVEDKVNLKNLLNMMIGIDQGTNNFYSTTGTGVESAGAMQLEATRVSNPII